MFKRLLLFTVVLLLNITFAQKNPFQHNSNMAPILNSPSGVNSLFVPTTVYYQIWGGTDWTETSKWEYPTYDSSGRETEYISYSFKDGMYVPAAREVYEYNNGELITTTYRYNEGQWEEYNRLTYSNFPGNDFDFDEPYDLLVEKWDSTNWVPSARIIYTYDNNGNAISSLRESYSSGTWNPAGQQFFQYDSNNYLIEHIGQYYSNGMFVNSDRYQYTYDQLGNKDITTTAYWENDAWAYYYQDDEDYDAEGNIIMSINSRFLDGNWVEITRYDHIYQNGIYAGYNSQKMIEGQWQDFQRLVNTIDQNDNITENLYQDFTEGAWVNSYRFAYIFSEITSIKKENEQVPSDFVLSQNYPNPFNPSTTIKFSIPQSGFVSLKIYDLLGNEIAALVNEELSPGSYSATFDASLANQNLASGIYFYRLESNQFSQTKKLMLIK